MTPACSDDGTGVVSTCIGVVIFLTLLLFAAHTLLGLYTESVVTAAAYDAAATLAGAEVVDDPAAAARITAQARQSLGRLGDHADITWSADADAVRLTVRVPHPAVLPGLLPALRGPIERTVRIRAERVR